MMASSAWSANSLVCPPSIDFSFYAIVPLPVELQQLSSASFLHLALAHWLHHMFLICLLAHASIHLLNDHTAARAPGHGTHVLDGEWHRAESPRLTDGKRLEQLRDGHPHGR